MGRGCWIAGVALLGTLTGWTEASADTLPAPTVRVKVFDAVGLPEEILRQAQREAGRIFEKAGINLTWIPEQAPSAGSLILKIIPAPMPGISTNRAVLGIAAGSKEGGRVAFLFYDRINDLRELLGLDASQMVGCVIAHEMGHLLLGYRSHSVAGIMKGGWDRNQAIAALTGGLTFQSDQVRRIVSRLQERR